MKEEKKQEKDTVPEIYMRGTDTAAFSAFNCPDENSRCEQTAVQSGNLQENDSCDFLPNLNSRTEHYL